MNHLKKIAAELPKYGLDAMVITSAPGEFYAIGFRGEGLVLVTREGCRYYTDSRYIEAAGNQVTDAEIILHTAEHPMLKQASECIAEMGLKVIGFEEQYLTCKAYTEMQQQFPRNVEFVPAGQLLVTLRACKDADELEAMRKAQEITDRTFAEIVTLIKPGVKECEVAAQLTYLMMSMGASKNSFDPIVASGVHGSMPHAIPDEKEIQSGEFVTLDFGCVYGGYCSDMTRTVAVGEPTEEMKKVYHTVLAAQKAGIAAAKAGVSGKSVHEAAHNVIRAAGYGDYFGHGFGHSLGIEIHEQPRANSTNEQPMPLGCMCSAEPGIYLPGKFGVRIEDVIWYQEDGCIDITNSPKELMIL